MVSNNKIYIATTTDNSFSKLAYISTDIVNTIEYALEKSILERDTYLFIEEHLLDRDLKNVVKGEKPIVLIFNGHLGLGVPGFNEKALMDRDATLQYLQSATFEDLYNSLCQKFDTYE